MIKAIMIGSGSDEEEQPQLCGEYWFLVPPVASVLDTSRPDHQVLLLVDKV